MQHDFNYTVLVVSPVLGLIFDILLPKKVVTVLLIISALLLAPIFFGYISGINYFFETAAVIFSASIYFFITRRIKQKSSKVALSISTVVILFIGVFGYAYMHLFSGQEYVRKVWDDGERYRIEYIEEAGFSGKHLMSYRLEKYSIIPVYVKQMARVREEDTTKNGYIIFTDTIKFSIMFDKHSGKLIPAGRL